MSYYIQNYRKGHIQRNGDQYELVEDGKIVGSYKSVETLVKYNPVPKPAKEASPEDTSKVADKK